MSDDVLLVEAVIADELDQQQWERLRERLEDPAFRDELGGALALVGALRAGREAARRDAELQHSLRRLLPEPGTEPFAERVMQRVRRPSRRSRRAVSRRRPQRGRRSSRPVAVASAAVALLVVTVTAVALLRHPRSSPAPSPPDTAMPERGPILWQVDGPEVTVVGSDGLLHVTPSLVRGDRLAARSGPVVLLREDASRVTLRAEGVLRVQEATTLELVHGRLEAAIVPQDAAHPFRVRAPHAEVAVIGTRFEVAATAASTRVAVAGGRVRVRAPGYQRLVVAGETLELPAPPQAIRTVALIDAPDGRVISGYERIEDGRELLLRELPTEVNFVVGVADEIESMRCELRDSAGREIGGSHQESRPFSVFGDRGDGSFERFNLQPGSYRLRLAAFTTPEPGGEPRELREIAFTVSAR